MARIDPAENWCDRFAHGRRLPAAAVALALLAGVPSLAQEVEPFGGAPANDPLTELPPAAPTEVELRTDPAQPRLLEQPDGAEADRNLSGGKAVAAEPDNRRAEAAGAPRRAMEEDPYAPLGLRLGTVIVKPSLEQGLTSTTNASSSADGGSAVLSETELRLDVVSDWSRHSAALSAYGSFRKSISGEELSDPEGGFDADLVLDLGNEFRGSASASYFLQPESATSPIDLPPTTSRPLRQNGAVALGVEKAAGKLRLGLTGKVERQSHGDADLEGGGTLSQRERDFVLTTAVLRAGYEISPALTPFVEAEVGRRAHDVAFDANGYDRSAVRTGIRAGLAIDLGEKFFGDVSAGWLREDIDDPRLGSISAASLGADLYWSPRRGTLLGLQTETTIEGATAPGESGSVLYSGQLSLERQMRANLTGNALLGAEYRDYAGSGGYDLTLSAEAGLIYWLNRYTGLTGRVRHEEAKSDKPSREAEASSVFLGLRLQR